jgi:hypothetical protein
MTFIEPNHDSFFKEIDNPWSVGWEEEVQRIHKILWAWKILDLWFWVWRHIKQFLDLNYDLTGIELSKIWYMRLQDDLKNKNQYADLYHWDMFDFDFNKQYDCIFSNMTLQYANSEQQFSQMIEKMKQYTKQWWINYIKLPAAWMSLWFPFKILDLEALISYYSDWEILFDKFETQKKDDGKIWVYVTIIARKKS